MMCMINITLTTTDKQIVAKVFHNLEFIQGLIHYNENATLWSTSSDWFLKLTADCPFGVPICHKPYERGSSWREQKGHGTTILTCETLVPRPCLLAAMVGSPQRKVNRLEVKSLSDSLSVVFSYVSIFCTRQCALQPLGQFFFFLPPDTKMETESIHYPLENDSCEPFFSSMV
jgi:hypothetical protein